VVGGPDDGGTTGAWVCAATGDGVCAATGARVGLRVVVITGASVGDRVATGDSAK
jgi:hypothetical protein